MTIPEVAQALGVSERTVNAINEISELVDETRTHIQEAVSLTKVGSLAVKRSSSEILSFGNKFEEIFKTVEETDAQVREILTATEQQALSKHGLNFVMDEYLPDKLKNRSKFLP